MFIGGDIECLYIHINLYYFVYLYLLIGGDMLNMKHEKTNKKILTVVELWSIWHLAAIERARPARVLLLGKGWDAANPSQVSRGEALRAHPASQSDNDNQRNIEGNCPANVPSSF